MHRYKAIAILALCLLIAHQPAPGRAAAAPAAQGLLPLPERRAPEPVLQGQPGVIQYVQSNVSVPIDSEHEIDLNSPPQRIDAPIQLDAIAADPDSPALLEVRQRVTTLLDGATDKDVTTTTTTTTTTIKPFSSTTQKPKNGISGLKTGLLFMTVIMISAGLTINSAAKTRNMRI